LQSLHITVRPFPKRDVISIVADDVVINHLLLSVALESGQFETKLRVSFPCSLDDSKRALDQWLEFAMTGLRIGASEMTATLEKKHNADK